MLQFSCVLPTAISEWGRFGKIFQKSGKVLIYKTNFCGPFSGLVFIPATRLIGREWILNATTRGVGHHGLQTCVCRNEDAARLLFAAPIEQKGCCCPFSCSGDSAELGKVGKRQRGRRAEVPASTTFFLLSRKIFNHKLWLTG